MPRPPKPEAEKKTEKVTVRLTKSDYSSFEKSAAEIGISLPDFFRTGVGIQARKTVLARADADAIKTLVGLKSELGRIGGLLSLGIKNNRQDGSYIDAKRELEELRCVIDRTGKELVRVLAEKGGK